MGKQKHLHEQLKQLMEESEPKLSQSDVARAIGKSESYVSQFLNTGEIPGNLAKFQDAIKSFIDKETERKALPDFRFKFLTIKNAKLGLQTARLCHLNREIGVVYGEAGTGKTKFTEEYASKNKDVILIQTTPGLTTKHLFRKLYKMVCGSEPVLLSIQDIFEEIQDRLQDSGRFIIVDESEHLNVRSLELIRRLYDFAHIGILLVGMPRLISNLRGKKGDFKQLYSRVGMSTKLDDSFSSEDIESIVKLYFPGSNGVWRNFEEISNGNGRTLEYAIKRAIHLCEVNNCDISAKVVNTVKTMLIR